MPKVTQRTEGLASLPRLEEDNWWFQWVMPSAWDDGKQIYDEETLGPDHKPDGAPIWGGVQYLCTAEHHGSPSVEVQGRYWGLLAAVWILWLQTALISSHNILSYYFVHPCKPGLLHLYCRTSAYRQWRRRILRPSCHKWKKCGAARSWAWWHSRTEENWCWKGQRQQRSSLSWRIVWWYWGHCWATGTTEQILTCSY